MKLAIMQPYFLPYVGYFQLIASADVFIVYDNIKHTKKGWINRNRLLVNNAPATFSLPLKRGSDSLQIVERELAADFDPDTLINRFRGAYARAPQFRDTFPLLERIVRHDDQNLFRYLHHAIACTCEHLKIGTEIQTSSEIVIDHTLEGQDKVLALCQAVGANTYINSIGGTELYAKHDFNERGVELRFIRSRPFEYTQFGAPFVPWLSIVDVLMFNPLNSVCDHVATHYDLL